MRLLLAIAAVMEGLTGLVLFVYPPVVVRLLFGGEIAGVGIVVCRLTGISLMALAVACWPDELARRGLYGLLTYNAFASLYLAYVAIGREWTGKLLWPAIVLHAGLAALIFKGWLEQRKTPRTKS